MNDTATILDFPMHRVRPARATDGFPPGWPAGPVGEEMEKLARLTMARVQSKGTEISLPDCRAVIYTVVCGARPCH